MTDPAPTASPPLAFTQGVGTVFQFTGVILFLAMSVICCSSSLLGKDTAERPDLEKLGWHLAGDPPDRPFYSVPRALSTSLTIGVALGAAVAGLGLGLQATHRSAAIAAVLVTPLATLFWIAQVIFAARIVHSVVLCAVAVLLAVLFLVLTGLSFAALRDTLLHPPPPDHEVLPPGYKIPYSWYHDDPPEVRLAGEIEQRRRKLAVEQKELEMLEEKLRRKDIK
jgi:lysylphosphatidylglycerol synthetase-like protein (DUF2156 family)